MSSHIPKTTVLLNLGLVESFLYQHIFEVTGVIAIRVGGTISESASM